MVLTCSACCHGRSETLIPTRSFTTHSQQPLLRSHPHHCHDHRHRERDVIAHQSTVSRTGIWALLLHVGTPPRRVHMVGSWKRGYKRRDAYKMAQISTPLSSQSSSLIESTISVTTGDMHGYVHALAISPGTIQVHAVLAGSDQTVGNAIRLDVGTEPISTLIVPDHASIPSIPISKRVVLVRHGQSTWNAEGRIQGSSDFAILTAKGESQAETSRQMLLSDSFDVCFHSPLARAKRTAEIIWGSRTDPMIPIHDLREIDLYGFQGLMKNEGKERYGDAYRTWQADAANFIIDGHYPVRELWLRAQKCWYEILCHKGQSILVVAHNAVNQALVATATGLGPEYFRQLLQSNCGVSVLDFTPRSGGDGPPYVCLDRLNQTPGPPVAGELSSGRKAAYRIILVCHGATESSVENRFPESKTESLNMLGIIQSRKTAELLLDVKVSMVLSSPQPSARKTAEAIVEVQEAADCLGADCVPRYVEEKHLVELEDLDWGKWKGQSPAQAVPQGRWQDAIQRGVTDGGESFSDFWKRAGCAWNAVLVHVKELDATSNEAKNVVVVGHEAMHTAMVGHCLRLTPASIGTFHVDTGSLSVIDLPDGPSGRGVVRCLNYTAHLGRWAVPITMPTLADEDF